MRGPSVPLPDPSIAPAATVETTSVDGRRAALAMRGEFDLHNCDGFRTEVDRHLGEGRPTIRVDVSQVDFLDSWAVGELVHAHERCRAAGGSLVLTGAPPRQQRLLELLRLDDVLLGDDAAATG